MIQPLQWSVYDADLDPVVGSEQSGRRPVLIVSNDRFNRRTANVTVLPLTSTSRRLYPAEALLRSGAAGQLRDSIIMAHQIRTISKERLGHPLGYLDAAQTRLAVRSAIRRHLDLDD